MTSKTVASERGGGDDREAVTKTYVREMLELNPMWQSATILRRRRELWTGESDPAARVAAPSKGLGALTAEVSPANQRLEERARRCLEKLQSDFYRLPNEKLNEYIDFLHNERIPEFAAKAKRLKEVARHRDELLHVEQETGDRKYSYSLLQGLVSPPAQAGSLKEQYIEAIIEERRVKPSCRMVSEFIQRHPEIYALERDWFDLFLSKENQNLWISRYSFASRYRAVVGNRQLNLVAIAVVIAISIIIPLVGSSKLGRTPAKSDPIPKAVVGDALRETTPKKMEELGKFERQEVVPPSSTPVAPRNQVAPQQNPLGASPMGIPDDGKVRPLVPFDPWEEQRAMLEELRQKHRAMRMPRAPTFPEFEMPPPVHIPEIPRPTTPTLPQFPQPQFVPAPNHPNPGNFP